MGNTNCRTAMTDYMVDNNFFYRTRDLVTIAIVLLIWFFFVQGQVENKFLLYGIFPTVLLILVSIIVKTITKQILIFTLDQDILHKRIEKCKRWQDRFQYNCRYGDINDVCIINPDDVLTWIEE